MEFAAVGICSDSDARGAVDLQQPGIYRIELNSDGNATATLAAAQSRATGSGQIQKGESLVVPCNGKGTSAISKVEPNQAGRTSTTITGSGTRVTTDVIAVTTRIWTILITTNPNANIRVTTTSAMAFRRLRSGLRRLALRQQLRLRMAPARQHDWAPYQSGYWTMDYPYGLTWVSNEPWGYAPYHYGRWASVSNEWFWVPEATSVSPTYSPALVAFIPFNNSSVAWVALGPGDPYATRYYDQYWQPTYAYPSTVVVDRVVNVSVPGAVTVVPVRDSRASSDPRVVTHADVQTHKRVRPVLDPLTVASLRNAAFETREARGKEDRYSATGSAAARPYDGGEWPAIHQRRRSGVISHEH
jgi:hypothetical protein